MLVPVLLPAGGSPLDMLSTCSSIFYEQGYNNNNTDIALFARSYTAKSHQKSRICEGFASDNQLNKSVNVAIINAVQYAGAEISVPNKQKTAGPRTAR